MGAGWRLRRLESLTIASTIIENTEAVAAGSPMGGPGGLPAPLPRPSHLPAFCKVTGVIRDRTGADGKHYGIRFEVRLPANWNSNFFFQGGGGMDGFLLPAIGIAGSRHAPRLSSAVTPWSAMMEATRGRWTLPLAVNSRLASTTPLNPPSKPRAWPSNSSAPTTASRLCTPTSWAVRSSREAMMALERTPLDFDGAIADDAGLRLPTPPSPRPGTHRLFSSLRLRTQIAIPSSTKPSPMPASSSSPVRPRKVRCARRPPGRRDHDVPACKPIPGTHVQRRQHGPVPEPRASCGPEKIFWRSARLTRQCALFKLALWRGHRRDGLRAWKIGTSERPRPTH